MFVFSESYLGVHVIERGKGTGLPITVEFPASSTFIGELEIVQSTIFN